MAGQEYGIYLVVAFAAVFLLWYFAGAALTRRRLSATARWVYQGLDVFRDPRAGRTKASIKWLATNAFNILLEKPRAPLREVVVTVLLQSRDMVTVWVIDRFTGRRDLLLLRIDLERQPIWGVEVFRRHSILAGESRRRAADEGWEIGELAASRLLAAHGGGRAADLGRETLAAMGEWQDRLVRLSVGRQTPHLSLALDLPDPGRADPAEVLGLGLRVAEAVGPYCTS